MMNKIVLIDYKSIGSDFGEYYLLMRCGRPWSAKSTLDILENFVSGCSGSSAHAMFNYICREVVELLLLYTVDHKSLQYLLYCTSLILL